MSAVRRHRRPPWLLTPGPTADTRLTTPTETNILALSKKHPQVLARLAELVGSQQTSLHAADQTAIWRRQNPHMAVSIRLVTLPLLTHLLVLELLTGLL